MSNAMICIDQTFWVKILMYLVWLQFLTWAILKWKSRIIPSLQDMTIHVHSFFSGWIQAYGLVVVTRQWPEVYYLCHTFLHVARVNVKKRSTKCDTSGHCPLTATSRKNWLGYESSRNQDCECTCDVFAHAHIRNHIAFIAYLTYYL